MRDSFSLFRAKYIWVDWSSKIPQVTGVVKISTCLPASILCWRRSPRPESPTETPQLTKRSWWRVKAALTQPFVCDQPCDILALYVRGKRLGCTRAGTFLLTHTRGKTQPCLSLLSNWAGYEIQTACRRNMELCTETQLCRNSVFNKEVVFAWKRQEYSSLYDKPSHFGPRSLIFRVPMFLQLSICSSQPKTALHSVALNGTQVNFWLSFLESVNAMFLLRHIPHSWKTVTV